MSITAVDDVSSWTLPRLLATRADELPDQPFLHVVGPQDREAGFQTYGEVHRAALAVGSGLAQLGVAAGDTVVLLGQNRLPLVHAWFGLSSIGAVESWLNPNYRGRSLVHAINLVGAEVAVVDADLVPALLEVEDELPRLESVVVLGGAPPSSASSRRRVALVDHRDVVADGLGRISGGGAHTGPSGGPTSRDPASIIFTSGTTGPAKGVLMPHAQTLTIARAAVEILRMGRDDTFYSFHPMFHMVKFTSIVATLIAGGRVVLDVGFDPSRWLSTVRQHGATLTNAHGPMLEQVHAQPEDPDDHDNPLRAVMCGPFPAAIANDFEHRFGVRGIETWGMSELSLCAARRYDSELVVGSAGQVHREHYDVRIVDAETDAELPTGTVGEIVVRPQRPFTMMLGYVGMPEQSVRAWRNLWFHTGDAGYIDDHDRLFFVDRLGDRIRRRGENISSYEIEVAAKQHPGVRDAAAVGVDSGFESDDDIALVVELMPPGTLDPEDVFRHVALELPHHMVPRYVRVVPELPRTRTQKIRKQELREQGTKDAWDRRVLGLSLREFLEQARTPEGEI